jgi:hypothetical protein
MINRLALVAAFALLAVAGRIPLHGGCGQAAAGCTPSGGTTLKAQRRVRADRGESRGRPCGPER